MHALIMKMKLQMSLKMPVSLRIFKNVDVEVVESVEELGVAGFELTTDCNGVIGLKISNTCLSLNLLYNSLLCFEIVVTTIWLKHC